MENKTNIIYEIIMSKDELTTKILNNNGINSKHIRMLIQEGILIRLKRGIYTLSNLDYLYNYGINLLNTNTEKAIKCLNRCIEIDSNYLKASERLLSIYLESQNYNEAFKCIDFLYKHNPTKYGIYLYLLNAFSSLDEYYQNICKNMNLSDIEILPKNDYQIFITLILQNYFLKAYQILLENNKFEDENLTLLLRNAKNAFMNEINEEKELIKNHKYQELLIYMKNLLNKRKLSSYEEYILQITLDIIAIFKINIYKEHTKEENILKLIANKDYKLALELIENGYGLEEDAIHLALKDINKIIRIIEDKKSPSIMESLPKDESMVKQSTNLNEENEDAIMQKTDDIQAFLIQKYDYMVMNNLSILLLDNISIEEENIIKSLLNKESNFKCFTVGKIVPQLVLQRYEELDDRLSLIKYIKNQYRAKLYQDVVINSKKLLRNIYHKDILIILIKALVKLNNFDEALYYLNILAADYDELGINTNINEIIKAIKEHNPNLNAIINNFYDVNKINLSLYDEILEMLNLNSKNEKCYIVLSNNSNPNSTNRDIKELSKFFNQIRSFQIYKNTDKQETIVIKTCDKPINKDEILTKIDESLAKKDYLEANRLINIIISALNNSMYGLRQTAKYFSKLGYNYNSLGMYTDAKECFLISEGINQKLNLPYSQKSILEKVEANKNEADYLNAKQEEMKQKGLLYLPLERETIYKKYLDTKYKILKLDNKFYMLPPREYYIEKKDILEVHEYYDNGFYQKALDKIKMCLKSLSVNPYVLLHNYHLLGKIYMKLEEYGLATYYLSFALKIASNIKNDYYINIISNLLLKAEKLYYSSENAKAITDFTLKEFEEEHNNQLEKIACLLIGTEYKIEDLQEKYNLSVEDIQIINLIIAREYYTNADYINGDYYFKLVEKSKGKTIKVKKMFADIQSKKLFLKNRKAEAIILSKK